MQIVLRTGTGWPTFFFSVNQNTADQTHTVGILLFGATLCAFFTCFVLLYIAIITLHAQVEWEAMPYRPVAPTRYVQYEKQAAEA